MKHLIQQLTLGLQKMSAKNECFSILLPDFQCKASEMKIERKATMTENHGAGGKNKLNIFFKFCKLAYQKTKLEQDFFFVNVNLIKTQQCVTYSDLS